MFNLLVSANPWENNRCSYSTTRVLQNNCTSDEVKARFAPNGIIDFLSLKSLPALFVEETSRGQLGQVARVGRILEVRTSTCEITIEYIFDSTVPPIPQLDLIKMERELGIISNPRKSFGELSTSHWAVKDHDLFRALHTSTPSRKRVPKAFSLPFPGHVQPDQLSAMMPFKPSFNLVYEAIFKAAQRAGMRCDRVDGIWENHSVIQDVISLIDRSQIVICDCSERNPNVFYEIGVAHALGKEVVLITQSNDDVPFDLRHLRYIQYLNNGEGLRELEERLVTRILSPLQ